MKKLGKLNLHNLAQSEMAKREQNVIRGGICACVGVCFCKYAGEKEGPDDHFYGGSSENDNGNANTQPNANSNHS